MIGGGNPIPLVRPVVSAFGIWLRNLDDVSKLRLDLSQLVTLHRMYHSMMVNGISTTLKGNGSVKPQTHCV